MEKEEDAGRGEMWQHKPGLKLYIRNHFGVQFQLSKGIYKVLRSFISLTSQGLMFQGDNKRRMKLISLLW